MVLKLRFVFLLLGLAAALAAPARALDPIQSGIAREAAKCISWAPGRVDCFARSNAGTLTWVYLQNEQWSAPKDLGGKLAGPPSCVARGPGGINCFAPSAKGVLATINLNGKTWSAWSSLGGDLAPSRPACLALARDRIVCYARGRRGQLLQRRWGGGKSWDPWVNLGGALASDPECIAVGGGVACFGRGTADELVGFLPDATGKKGGWSEMGGRIDGTPSCARLKSGEAACAAQSRSGRLFLWRGMPLFQSEEPGRIVQNDETTAGDPTCIMQTGAFVCFLRTNGRGLVRKSLIGALDASTDGELDLPASIGLSCLTLNSDGVIGCGITDNDKKLYFATAGALEAGEAPNSDDEAGEDIVGAWFLSNVDTRASCRVVLTELGGNRVQMGPRCRAVGIAERPVQWDQDDDGLVLLARDGEILLRFSPAHDGRWITPPKSGALMLSRELPEAVNDTAVTPAPLDARLSEMFGPWRVLNDAAGYLCTLKLTNQRAAAGYEIAWDPACESRFPAARYWTESAGAIVFVGPGDIVVARFDANGPGKWRLQGHAGITLLR